MTFDQPDTLTVFGSSRDSAPITLLGQHAPAGAVWARCFVAADTLNTAIVWLESVGLTRTVETLEQIGGSDWVGQAVGRFARQLALPEFHALIYIVVASHPDLGRPVVYQLNEKHTGWVEVGYIGLDGGPVVLPVPDAFVRAGRIIPIET